MTASLLAASTYQRVGTFLAAGLVVAWLVYVFIASRQRDPETPPGSEIELAPNRKPYYDDDVLEGRRLERYLGWALVLLIVCAVGPLVYWLNEPSRQAGAAAAFDRESVGRGRELFQPTDSPEPGAHFGCANCHGSAGQGGVAAFTLEEEDGTQRQVQWVAPPVDTALLKFSREEVRTILVYGRPNTPMPAWGVLGGGPMNDQQIDDLVNYLQSIALTPAEARKRSRDEARQQAEADGDASVDGETLFKANCARCHTKGWSYGEPDVMGGGAFGPNLTNGAAVRQFPDVEDMIEFIEQGSEPYKPYGVRGVGDDAGGGMPGFARVLTPAQIRAVVEYVRGL